MRHIANRSNKPSSSAGPTHKLSLPVAALFSFLKQTRDARGVFTEVFSATNLRKAFEYAAVEVGLGVWRDPENPYYCGCDSLIVHNLRRSGVVNLQLLDGPMVQRLARQILNLT